MIVVMGDLNVKVENNNVNREDGSLRAGSLSVLFARVSWRQNRDLRASERASERKAPFFSPARFARRLANRGSAAKILARITHK